MGAKIEGSMFCTDTSATQANGNLFFFVGSCHVPFSPFSTPHSLLALRHGQKRRALWSRMFFPFHQYELLTSTKSMHRVIDTTPTEHTVSVPCDHELRNWKKKKLTQVLHFRTSTVKIARPRTKMQMISVRRRLGYLLFLVIIDAVADSLLLIHWHWGQIQDTMLHLTNHSCYKSKTKK